MPLYEHNTSFSSTAFNLTFNVYFFVGSLYVATGNFDFDLAVAWSARPIPMPLEYAIHAYAVHNNNSDLEITIS